MKRLKSLLEDTYPTQVNPSPSNTEIVAQGGSEYDKDEGPQKDKKNKGVSGGPEFSKILADLLKDNGVVTVVEREKDGSTSYDMALNNDVIINVALVKEIPHVGEDPEWMILASTPRELFKHPVKVTEKGDGVLITKEDLDNNFLKDLVSKWRDPGDQFECLSTVGKLAKLL